MTGTKPIEYLMYVVHTVYVVLSKKREGSTIPSSKNVLFHGMQRFTNYSFIPSWRQRCLLC